MKNCDAFLYFSDRLSPAVDWRGLNDPLADGWD